jgi:major membrane immunogen (membrane-anchored lipoprotein)
MAKKPEEGFHQLTDEVLKKLINDRVDGQTPITFSEEELVYYEYL